ncbi:MAG: NAD(P)H-dependent oxidoreductase [Acidobacteriota bacterium]|nr:NAD(P)H-dependent oxidoreductase [Acidobacteriota bacterium]
MSRRIAIVQGHPEPHSEHYGHALMRAYREAAEQAGHHVKEVRIADLDFPILRSKAEWDREAPPAIAEAQYDIAWAEHLVLEFPLWLGGMPALLKGFLEQVLRPGFAFDPKKGPMSPRLKGKSAHIVVTMGMPAAAFRFLSLAHGVKTLDRSILKFTGVAPIRTTLIGRVESGGAQWREKWIGKMREFGANAL